MGNQARKLIEQLGRRRRLTELVQVGRRYRPDVDWPDAPEIAQEMPEPVSESDFQPLFVIGAQGQRQPLGLEIEPGFDPRYIEVELLAAGFEVEGEKRQRHSVFGREMMFQWNIRASRSGDYEVGLVFRVQDAAGEFRVLGVRTRQVRVFKLVGLTGRQLWGLTGFFGLLAVATGAWMALD